MSKISDVFRNYVPKKFINCNDKGPVWMNKDITSKVKNNEFYKNILKVAEKKLILKL